MSNLDPTYLRYIYDNLNKGSVHLENSSELPEGLIGLYEEAFEEHLPVIQRQQLLQRFALFALLKKEVSVHFVAEVLDENEEEIIDFINAYASWFNSPEPGKFQLFHERLKVYLLQKISEQEVAILNESIVDFLEQNVKEEKVNELVLYCFEFLSFHLFLTAYLSGKNEHFASYCLDDTFKKRQFELSGYYDWEEKMMVLGVEYFSLKQDSICHQIVFEKTKIQYKKKDIQLILSLIRTGEIEIVYHFFRNINEINLYARVETAYFYFFSFFEIFEKKDWNFIKKKEVSSRLLEIFENNFQWDSVGHYLSEFVDVNISFRLHCYFEQFGLDFKIISLLSSDQLQLDEPLKFIAKNHLYEANIILKDFKKFDYGRKDDNLKEIVYSEYEVLELDEINEELQRKITDFSKMQLIRDELAYSGDNYETFDELCNFVKQTLRKIDITRDIKWNVLRELSTNIKAESKGLFSIKGNIENSDGKNTLELIRNDFDKQNEELKSLSTFISGGFIIEEFLSLDIKNRYKFLYDETLDSDEDIKLMCLLIELSEYYQKEKPIDLFNLLSALLVEFHLNMHNEFIEEYTDDLLELISSSNEENEEFESKFFNQLLDFFNRRDINGHINNTLKLIQDNLLETYFNFSFYNYSFVSGCKLINLFSKYKLDFAEMDVVNRIIEDLDCLIEENDINQMWGVIEDSYINNIYQKPYFWDFYNAVKRIQSELVREQLSEYIFEDILFHQGINQKTVLFFRDNSTDYPEMYKWAIKRLSKKISETNQFLSYLPIMKENDQLMERLLQNIVSSREQLNEPLNIKILKHYGLDWVIKLDNEFENIIANN